MWTKKLDYLKRISNEHLLLLPWRRIPHPRETTFLTFPKDQPALLNLGPGALELKVGEDLEHIVDYLALERSQNRNVLQLR